MTFIDTHCDIVGTIIRNQGCYRQNYGNLFLLLPTVMFQGGRAPEDDAQPKPSSSSSGLGPSRTVEATKPRSPRPCAIR